MCGVPRNQHNTKDGKIIIAGIGSDNAAEFKSAAWEEIANRYNIQTFHSVPFTPQ